MKLTKNEMQILRSACATALNCHRERAINSKCEDFVDATYEIMKEIKDIQTKIETYNQ